ncbi:MAG: hypothetical protein ACOH2A_06530 [Sphingobacteriaceae bacterium]
MTLAKMLKRLFYAIAAFAILSAFITKDDPIDRLINGLQRWAEIFPQEKVYLHMDKPYYAAGDTIWFKAYVVIGAQHQLSAMSGALYVELVDEKGAIVRSLKLPVVAGTTAGDFTIDDQLIAGNYRVRAYTQWMRNADDEYFFNQHLMIVDYLTADTISLNKDHALPDKKAVVPAPSAGNLAQSDVQFFPEGGDLVYGISSRIGFKVIGKNGLGLDVQGVVMDQHKQTVNHFQTMHAGMGNFTLKPNKGTDYTAIITFSDGSIKNVPLPKPLDSGCVLAVYQPDSDSLLVRIQTTEPGKAVSLITQSGGDILFSAQINDLKSLNSIWVDKRKFPSGIAQFTLFDDSGLPINERIVFLDTNDQLQLNIKTDKEGYLSREPVNIELSSLDQDGKPASGNFSVSVIDETKVPDMESLDHSILSHFLLTSDLSGFIENPNYYFTKRTAQVRMELDNLLLTQGYRRFDWKVISTSNPPQPGFPAEQLGTVFSGKVLGFNNKVQPNAVVTMLSLKANLFQTTKTDHNGHFKFEGLVIADSIRMTFQAKSQKNSSRVELKMDTLPRMRPVKAITPFGDSYLPPKILARFLENSKKIDSIYEQTGRLGRVQRLKEVKIKARKEEQKYFSQGMISLPDGHSDLTIDMKNEKSFASMESFIREKLMGRGVKFLPFKPDTIGPTAMYYPWAYDLIRGILAPMKIIVDGRRLQPTEAIEIFTNAALDANDIAKIEVVVTGALTGMLGGPSIMFYTKADKFIRRPLNVVNLSRKGYNKIKNFYHAKYASDKVNKLPDLRSTIYWNANIRLDSTGKASFHYFNGDGPGNYKIIVQGVSSDGLLGAKTFNYPVK